MKIKEVEYQADAFTLIGGIDTFNRLLIYYQEGYIDVFHESIGNLFAKLEEKIECMKSTTFSRSIPALNAIADFELIQKFYNDSYCVNGNPNCPAIYDLITLPIPKDILVQILSFKPKTKTLGER